ncbi:MAG: TetR/AcrR family transcriptional regulator [Alphaproteobacteria bacterium]|nr:TetR/AcrR family transcriptional regulator [Alphaproteobacteria bacterium SS10]
MNRVDDILDAAEKRIRLAGYNGFSFRELAEDVGIKSASVHYHFPTKAALGEAVAGRYLERFSAAVSVSKSDGLSPLDAWRKAFRDALASGDGMCLCAVLGFELASLPQGVGQQAQKFFSSGIESLSADLGGDATAATNAARAFALLEGAMLLAVSLNDVDLFDRTTESLADIAA